MLDGWPVATLRFAVLLPGSARSTHHHNSKWPECNCAPAILSLTTCAPRTCENLTPSGKQACIPGAAKCSLQGHICLKIKSSFRLSSSYVQELQKKGPLFHPGHCSTIAKHHPTRHKALKLYGSYFLQQCKGLRHDMLSLPFPFPPFSVLSYVRLARTVYTHRI